MNRSNFESKTNWNALNANWIHSIRIDSISIVYK